MRFRDLGVLRVEVDDLEILLPGRRVATALGRLLVAAGETASADALIDAIWGEQPPARASQALETVVWRLRSVLEPGRAAGVAATVVRRHGDGYRLAVPAQSVDSRRFTDLTERAARALSANEPAEALELSQAGMGLWEGEPYASLTDAPWLAPARQALNERRLELATCQIQALLDTGQPERALSVVLPLLEEHPFHERFWGQRMLALYRSGRQADALAAFDEARRVLADELGVDPGPMLRSLQTQLLNHAPELDVPARLEPRAEGPVRLPRRRGRLIGREDVVADVIERTAAHGLVTLTGSGGVGKTRVAVEVGHRLRDRYPDGVWFVDLAGVRTEEGDAARLREIVATLLELAPRSDIPVGRILVENLRDRRLLLILDNCEQVLEAACVIVDEILASAQALTVLATTREALDLPGESVVQLSPLGPADASALFIDRLATARPDLDLREDDREQIERICESVGGLPLGIELAAARARMFELHEVETSLSDGAAGLSRSGRGPQRHASMLDAVDWGYRLARRDEQILHRRLAALPGAVSVEAAGVLCSVAPLTPDQAPTLLAGLVHRSLLTSVRPEDRRGATTFRQLVPTRAHAARALDPADRDAVRNACDRWVIDAIHGAPLDGRPGQAEASSWIELNSTAISATLASILVESSNPAALEVLAKLTLYWFERGQLLDAAHWYRAAVSAAESGLLSEPHAAIARTLDLCARALSQDRDAAVRVATEMPLLSSPRATLAPLVGEVLVLVSVSTWVAQQPGVGLLAANEAMIIGQRFDLPHVHIRARALAAMHRLRGPERGQAVADARRLLDADVGNEGMSNEFAAFVASYVCAVSSSADGDPAALGWARRLARAHRSLAMHPTSELLEDLGGVLARAGRRRDAVRCVAAAAARHARDGLPWPRLPHTAAVIAELQRSIPSSDYERLWRSGNRLGLSATPAALLDEWFPDREADVAGQNAALTA